MDHAVRALAVLVLFALTACGRAPESAPAGEGAATAPSTAENPRGDGAPSSDSPSSSLSGPVDACALLPADVVARFVPDAKATPTSRQEGGIEDFRCRWEPRQAGGMIPPSLEVSVMPGYIAKAGTTLEFVRAMLAAEAKEQNGKVIDGLGDIGVATSTIGASAEAKFVQRGALVSLDFMATGARDRVDEVAEAARRVSGGLR
jgi:predicted small lipoprotein YifL